jgi:hypothetical protein
VGAGNAAAYADNASSSRRTSASLLVKPGLGGPAMDSAASELQAGGRRLLRAGAVGAVLGGSAEQRGQG